MAGSCIGILTAIAIGAGGNAVREAIPDVAQFRNVEAQENLSQVIRSNVNHYWDFASNPQNVRELQDYLQYEGVVTGDPHLDNFSVVPVILENGRTELRFVNIDFDDAGRGPLALDFARLVIAVKAMDRDVKTKDMLSAYRRGLRGEGIEAPQKVRSALRMPMHEYEDREDALVNKHTQGDGVRRRFVFEEGKLEPYVGAIHFEDFANALPPGFQMLDIAKRPIQRGESAGHLRVWMLVQNARGRVTIMEFKERIETALRHYRPQPALVTWIQDVFATFWPGLSRRSYSLVEVTPNNYFWIRPKRVSLWDIPYTNDSDKAVAFVQDYSLYVANYLGRIHGRQAEGAELERRIDHDNDQFKEAVKAFSKRYLDVVTQAHQNIGE